MSTEFCGKGICLILLQVTNDLIVIVFDTMQLPCSDGDETRDRLQSAARKCTNISQLEGSFRRFCWISFGLWTLQTVPGSTASLRGHIHSSILEDVFIKAPSQLTFNSQFPQGQLGQSFSVAERELFPTFLRLLNISVDPFLWLNIRNAPKSAVNTDWFQI